MPVGSQCLHCVLSIVAGSFCPCWGAGCDPNPEALPSMQLRQCFWVLSDQCPLVKERLQAPLAVTAPSVCALPSYSSVASWVTHLRASFRRANRALWLSGLFLVLFAGLMSVLAGQLFQSAVEAAPTQEGDSWMSLEHIFWPLTRLGHDGPPPV